MKIFIIEENDKGQRLDRFLKKALPKLNSSSIYKYLRTKKIKVNKQKKDINYKVELNDKIEVYLNDEVTQNDISKTDFLHAKNSLDIVYEDKNIIIANKPIGVTVQDDNSKNPDTLNNRLLHYLYFKKEWDYEKETSFSPSFVHRLDRNTKGLIIAAKNVESSRILSEKIKTREIEKYYICKVYGIIDPKEGVLQDYWTKKTDNFVTITKKPINEYSKNIITKYKVLKHRNNISLVEIHLITGRTHQIRAHLNFINHPLVGEKKYTNIINEDKGKFQFLISYKIFFNFKTNAGILQYLEKKTFSIPFSE
ncbi:MAG: RluA family pseudouridine synthase [Mycoplasmataceae bacterium]|nr:RluA family pseudouridine synthase [Mycoplasmataceae bacterium]